MTARKTTTTTTVIKTIETTPETPEPAAPETPAEPTPQELFDQWLEAARVLRDAKNTESSLRQATDEAEKAVWQAENAFYTLDRKLHEAVRP